MPRPAIGTRNVRAQSGSSRGILLAGLAPLCLALAGMAAPPGFNHDIRPILADNCLACHGPDPGQRKGGLRLDVRAEALRPAKSGRPAIVPGKPSESTLLQRINSADPDEVMPPRESHKSLSAPQRRLLEQWIAAGAVYEAHWAFLPPVRPALPPVKRTAWPRNAIDHFILARLESSGLDPSPEADRTTLLRRVALDLTGLPPAPADVDAFLADTAPGAYERVVDRLLQSPHYGERMAVDWLDAARFADSNGYQVDRDREAYGWRDWVIRAFNANQPFDQFTLEQIAGDLLPGATLEQRIATGFHRNHMVNEEGGIIPEEFLAEYCADRVETTATVWLGQTFNCARCHDHKFDPFTQRDFYSLFAFFHNVAEKGIGDYGANIRRNNPPMIQLPAPAQEARRAQLRSEQAAVKSRLESVKVALTNTQPDWERRVTESSAHWTNVSAVARTGTNVTAATGTLPSFARGRHPFSLEFSLPATNASALRLHLAVPPATPGTASLSLAALSLVGLPGTNAPGTTNTPWTLRAAEIPGSVAAAEVTVALDPKGAKAAAVPLRAGEPTFLLVELDARGAAPAGRLRLQGTVIAATNLPPVTVELDFTDRDRDTLLPNSLRPILAKPAGQRTTAEAKQLADYRASRSIEHTTLTTQLASLERQLNEVELAIPTALVMQELPKPRATHVLMRGAYDRKGDVVTPRTPASLPPMPASAPANRLGLAQWLVDPANPLPARVVMNRFWQSVFGTGLVRTAEDFGAQGEAPSHPELLDWLATEFTGNGWDVKAMMRLLVTSATYRQDSRLTPILLERDPQNRLLARAPRFRLQAEFVRDQALAASGLLVRRFGGPSVRPYHPPGLYEQVVAGSSASTYVTGTGTELYRRSLYTYWKRSVPNPAMLLFDAPFREACTVRRPRTNTPLQALNLLNDPTFVEAARALAVRAVREGGRTPGERLQHQFRLVTGRDPRPAELAVLEAALARSLADFTRDPSAAGQLLKVGAMTLDPSLDPAEVAAYAMIAGTLLNLDEVIMKE